VPRSWHSVRTKDKSTGEKGVLDGGELEVIEVKIPPSRGHDGRRQRFQGKMKPRGHTRIQEVLFGS